MPLVKTDEQQIIKSALKLFRKQSYFNTSMAEIAKSSGLLKGSLYHYFTSKEDLMKKVIISVHDYFKSNVFSHAYNDQWSPKERMSKLFESASHVFLYKEDGTFIGNIGVESAVMSPEFAEIIRYFFLDFFHAVKTIYNTVHPLEESEELAERVVAEIEGSLMLCRLFNTDQYLKNTMKRLLKRLD